MIKKLFILLVVFITVQTATYAQEINEKSWTLIHERFATWCPYCGTWGWDLKDQMLAEFKNDNVIFMSVDYSGDLTNPTAKEFDSNFGGVGQPIFYVDGVNINATATNGTTKVQETRLEVDFKKDERPYIGVGVSPVLDDAGVLTANTKMKFLQDVEGGNYFIGMYLLEDVLAPQASRTGNQLHKNVLRASLLPAVFKNTVATGPVNKDTEFQATGVLTDLKGEADKYKVLSVVWTYNPSTNKYLFHNAFIAPVKKITATHDAQNDNVNFTAFQAESGNIVISLDKNVQVTSSTEIIVTDLSGKIIKQESSDIIHNGTAQIETNYTPGMHIISFKNNGKVSSKKVMLY